ncbi:MAG: CoA pyrophosphatase [Acidobacteria bacterium]|nr:CoA pyrophosphatase [Acidobacteriota bacterium]
MSTRGGSQRIPRPAEVVGGGPAPWADHKDIPDLTQMLENVAEWREPRVFGGPTHDGRSAVLALLYERSGEPHLLLTRRSEHLRSHTSEIAFPGGRAEAGDRSLWHTALRECQEEVGLAPEAVEKVGALDTFVTVGSNSLVHPFVGTAPTPRGLVADPGEVAAILEVPIAELLHPDSWREELWPMPDDTMRPMTFFELHGDTVWGATAAMVRQLLMIALGLPDASLMR